MNKQGKDGIEWCDKTLNPVVGCTFGCEYCYARRMNSRFKWIEDFSKPQFFPERLKQLRSMKPQTIFMDSMSDIADWKPEWWEETYKAMKRSPHHTYMFLTKRPEIYREYRAADKFMEWRIWWGATVIGGTDRQKAWDLLKNTSKRANKFLSIEPLLREFDLDNHELLLKDYKNIATIGNYIDWVIIGQQTGPGAKPPKDEWVQSIIDQCRAAVVPVFVKSPLYSRFPIQERPVMW